MAELNTDKELPVQHPGLCTRIRLARHLGSKMAGKVREHRLFSGGTRPCPFCSLLSWSPAARLQGPTTPYPVLSLSTLHSASQRVDT